MDTREASYHKLWINLKDKLNNPGLAKTKFVKNELQINTKILALINEEGEFVNQLDNFGFIILAQTNLSARTNETISDQGIITNGYFTAEVVDVSDKIIPGLTIHLVKVVADIVSINEIPVMVAVKEDLHYQILKNKLAAKLFDIALQKSLKLNKLNYLGRYYINDKEFKITFNKNLHVTKKMIFTARNKINLFLNDKTLLNDKETLSQKAYPWLQRKLSNKNFDMLNDLEKIEIKTLVSNKNHLIINCLVGNDNINDFLDNSKKTVVNQITELNKQIRLINNDNLSEFYPEAVVDSYEKLLTLNKQYLKLKHDFTVFKAKHADIIQQLVANITGMHYSETIGHYEIVHINFNHFLLNQMFLQQKAVTLLTNTSNRILFLSNSNSANYSLILTFSKNLTEEINFESLLHQFLPETLKKISYNNDNIWIEADNYQIINDLISNIINFFKISNKQKITNL